MLLSELGFRSLNEAIGHADVLSTRTDITLPKTNSMLDLGFITDLPDTKEDRSWLEHEKAHSNGPVLDDEILANPKVKSCIQEASQLDLDLEVCNTDRSVGGRIAGQVASVWGNQGFALAGGRLGLSFRGSAGQSFGLFNMEGLEVRLEGEANDYVGKGMNGGRIVIVPPRWGG
ncbi:unnamed protein product, partial [Discosporangium mesarthrocarpum]